MDTKRRIPILATVLMILALLGAVGILVLPRLERKPEDLSAAGETVWAYAKEQGITFRSWPQSLIDLLDRNPETEAFVLEYPTRKNQQEPVDMSQYRNCDAVPLFLQWDPSGATSPTAPMWLV